MGSRTILIAALALAPLAAGAQSYRCVDKQGKKYYSATIPIECLGQPVEQLSPSGTVLRRIDPAADEKARAEKEAQAAKRREDDALAREASRRNRALLATYTSEKDIEDARGRALADNAKMAREVEERIDAIKKRQAGYQKEMEFYQDAGGKNKGKSAPPPTKLVEDMRGAELELRLQEEALANRKKETAAINARYDEDRKDYLELTTRASSR